ncbi:MULTISPECIES: tRNA (adenine(22)-N(1))-methyltransferase [Bacillus]|uniref:tRNA (adenine(22)-N(1))-methyltransferase n=1 Tax=Bacillus TaxID=1386 RepID=UPI000BF1F92F|nr:tRNA (adenine(22)-N(1))-methyltransferase TrmK [Bacillus wiedmannii]MCU5703068.1 tRNA (adenine(22)-N(1))-methyltransferase TrmK [Bacillus wiedmannii]PEJ75061.1 tRNA (adenine(22)-N(1))-methyltransferase TrmK [Bacillus wiedmannii]PEM05706.1 tRNA (adenine(22)-N(1))-methyltransferase TrmK [Bacillus wiedmannii]PGA01925.1 tRNA (adenine(22)-N(1))-methyltransferase TrmK [Bacillus wiedmannii]PGB85563.1 tRNA (adenine(22)-N(1))-methyltransferase TrmK [Bacillus wiedmannii]
MNEVKLSKRLEEVVREIPVGSTVADIGSDHAYLPCYAIINNIATKAVAGEVVEGPFRSAQATVAESGLQDKVDVRKGNGLAVIAPGEVDVITVAGMGGALIRDILESGKEKLEGVTRLILQPNIAAHHIREWFIENGWELIHEKIVKEDGKIYEILVGERGNIASPYSENKQAELFMGPFLIKEKSEAFVEKWEGELKNFQNILKQLERAADSEETKVKRAEVEAKMKMIGEVLS